MIRSACLTLSRLCLAAWFGGGTMFVLMVLGLRGSPLFTNETKLVHPRVLFPIFYQMEFAFLSAAVLLAFAGAGRPQRQCFRGKAFLGVATLAWLAAIGDYIWVYQPLAAMLASPPLPDSFGMYHTLSRWANTAVLTCCLSAAITGPSSTAPIADG